MTRFTTTQISVYSAGALFGTALRSSVQVKL